MTVRDLIQEMLMLDTKLDKATKERKTILDMQVYIEGTPIMNYVQLREKNGEPIVTLLKDNEY